MGSSMDRLTDLPSGQLSEMMHPGRPWWAKEMGMMKEPGRSSHQRESSLTSTLGSTGPNSPCSPNIPAPHIAVNDSLDDSLRDGQGSNSWNYNFGPDPGPMHQDQLFYTGPPQLYGLQMNTHPDKSLYTTDGFIGSRATEPPPGMDTPYSPGMHQSIPMTSSASAPMMNSAPGHPRTSSGLQSSGESGEGSSQMRGKDFASLWMSSNSSLHAHDFTAMPDVPRLDRTMTDVYNDSLYNPNLDIISSASPSAGAPSSPGDDIFSHRLDAAGPMGYPQQRHGGLAARSHAGDLRPHDAQLFQDVSDTHSPQTISPQDSMLDFSETDAGSSSFPLFPRSDASRFGAIDSIGDGGFSRGHFEGGPDENSMQYLPADSSSSLFGSHDFPVFDTRQDVRPSDSMLPGGNHGAELMGLGPRPADNSENGTYSCTYHGCSQRFDTPALLQKHKREGHRQSNNLKSTAHRGAKSSVMDTQAGPHRCYRINPGTGKVCKAVFSRPYDLTRHEDTIHNARKQKVRCDLCTEEKLFSRADALTRHYRVCHPDVELPGKHKRRRPGGQS
ncbi:uncharacterized protein DNG_08483 [Cephalotrichum gorgonifer]|uniref:C2H2-type domain-containing protein n=1 Tax=Cephalotrichum gorgonifer TaxID=2041049 RepID=A0AAE8N3M0_9PEZI|nr:uncharacterized protein DNG_08483 [Cephalotrichum gorgonifer]